MPDSAPLRLGRGSSRIELAPSTVAADSATASIHSPPGMLWEPLARPASAEMTSSAEAVGSTKRWQTGHQPGSMCGQRNASWGTGSCRGRGEGNYKAFLSDLNGRCHAHKHIYKTCHACATPACKPYACLVSWPATIACLVQSVLHSVGTDVHHQCAAAAVLPVGHVGGGITAQPAERVNAGFLKAGRQTGRQADRRKPM